MFSCTDDTRTKDKKEKKFHLGPREYSYYNKEYFKHKSDQLQSKSPKKRIFDESPLRSAPYQYSQYQTSVFPQTNLIRSHHSIAPPIFSQPQGGLPLKTSVIPPVQVSASYANPQAHPPVLSNTNTSVLPQAQPPNYQYGYGYEAQYGVPAQNYQYQQGNAYYQNGLASVSQTGSLRESIKGETKVEYIPYEKTYIEHMPVQKVDYVPVEKKTTDYYAIERQREYVPVSKYETVQEMVPQERIEYIPQEKVEYVPEYRTEFLPVEQLEERVEYHPMERSILHYPRYEGEFHEAGRSGRLSGDYRGFEHLPPYRPPPPPYLHESYETRGFPPYYEDKYYPEVPYRKPPNYLNSYENDIYDPIYRNQYSLDQYGPPRSRSYHDYHHDYHPDYHHDYHDDFYGQPRHDLDLTYKPFVPKREEFLRHHKINSEYI